PEQRNHHAAGDLHRATAAGSLGDTGEPSRGQSKHDEDGRETSDVQQRAGQQSGAKVAPAVRIGDGRGACTRNAREIRGPERDAGTGAPSRLTATWRAPADDPATTKSASP